MVYVDRAVGGVVDVAVYIGSAVEVCVLDRNNFVLLQLELLHW